MGKQNEQVICTAANGLTDSKYFLCNAGLYNETIGVKNKIFRFGLLIQTNKLHNIRYT